MPIYEYYCPDCHTIFSFLARSAAASKRPRCPRCGRTGLQRRVSSFAISKGRPETDDGLPDVDEQQMERAMTALAAEADGLDEQDPRQVAGLMRRFYDVTGLKLGDGIEEAIRRMEAGEDPDQIEQEMGELLEQEDPLGAETKGGRLKSLRRRLRPPEVDRTLYEL